MFETSVVRVRAAAAPRRFGLLSASVGFHSLVIIAAVAMTVASVDFPKKAPNEFTLFRPVAAPALPPALGAPHAVPKPAPVPAAPRPTPLAAVTAPQVVPDAVVPAPTTVTTTGVAATGTQSGGGGTGRPDGVPGGVGASEVPAGPGAGEILTPGGEVKPAVVLHRVDPIFPRAAIAGHLNGTVVVRCIIGMNGVCRDPGLVSSTLGIFNQPAIDAVTQWRFAPGTYRGKTVDTYFELTVRFNVR
jgi:protein TonB